MRSLECGSNKPPLVAKDGLRGVIDGNDALLAPIFYLSAALGPQPEQCLAGLVGGDDRFFLMSPGEAGQDYNYNENSSLVQAIKAGYRGAFWDILRRSSTASISQPGDVTDQSDARH